MGAAAGVVAERAGYADVAVSRFSREYGSAAEAFGLPALPDASVLIAPPNVSDPTEFALPSSLGELQDRVVASLEKRARDDARVRPGFDERHRGRGAGEARTRARAPVRGTLPSSPSPPTSPRPLSSPCSSSPARGPPRCCITSAPSASKRSPTLQRSRETRTAAAGSDENASIVPSPTSG